VVWQHQMHDRRGVSAYKQTDRQTDNTDNTDRQTDRDREEYLA